MNRIADLIKNLLIRFKKNKYNKMTMKIVFFYLFFIVLLLFTWYGAWLYTFSKSGDANLSALSNFIIICIGATGFFGFIIECFVDKNHNGIPDKFEQNLAKKEITHESNRHF